MSRHCRTETKQAPIRTAEHSQHNSGLKIISALTTAADTDSQSGRRRERGVQTDRDRQSERETERERYRQTQTGRQSPDKSGDEGKKREAEKERQRKRDSERDRWWGKIEGREKPSLTFPADSNSSPIRCGRERDIACHRLR